MNKIRIEDLYQRLQIPNDVIAKFSNIKQKKHIDFLIDLFYKDEDGFFEYLETNLKEAYVDVLYVYLNLAVILHQKYLDNGIDIKVYYDTIDDIRIWAKNCLQETGEYGLKEIYWLNEHLRMRIFKLGRLQFQKREATEFMDLVKKHGLSQSINRDYFYFVHIPEGERLTYELVLDSYQKAKDFFDDEMIFACESWMLSDRLELVFNSDSNVLKFRNDFHLLEQRRDENHITRYLREGSSLLNKVTELEEKGIMIGEGFGLCLKYLEPKLS